MNNKNERKSDIMAKKKTEQQENVTLNDDQLKQVWDWWEGWADKGNEPANDYERRRFQCYDSALNAIAVLEETAESDKDFAGSRAYEAMRDELQANRDVAAVMCAEFLGIINE